MARTLVDEIFARFGLDYNQADFRRFGSTVDRAKGKLDSITGAATVVGGALTALGVLAAAVFVSGTRAAIEWESAFTGVRKTVSGTEEELLGIERSLLGIASSRVPLPHEELAAIAEAAGQLGIETKNVEGFTEVMAMLGVTTNLSSGAAATQFARFANIMGTEQTEFDRMGSTVVDLGNNFATTESEIADFALRLAGAGKVVGFNEAEILGLSAALASVGLEPEAGGTAFSRVLLDMEKAMTGTAKAGKEPGQLSPRARSWTRAPSRSFSRSRCRGGAERRSYRASIGWKKTARA